jgi:hypothetical protein
VEKIHSLPGQVTLLVERGPSSTRRSNGDVTGSAFVQGNAIGLSSVALQSSMMSPSKAKVFQTKGKGMEFSAEPEVVVKTLSEDDLKAIKLLEAKAAEDQKRIDV